MSPPRPGVNVTAPRVSGSSMRAGAKVDQSPEDGQGHFFPGDPPAPGAAPSLREQLRGRTSRRLWSRSRSPRTSPSPSSCGRWTRCGTGALLAAHPPNGGATQPTSYGLTPLTGDDDVGDVGSCGVVGAGVDRAISDPMTEMNTARQIDTSRMCVKVRGRLAR